MTRTEEAQELLHVMKGIDGDGRKSPEKGIKRVSDEVLIDLFEAWAYQIAEGSELDHEDVEYYYDLCRSEILRRMAVQIHG